MEKSNHTNEEHVQTHVLQTLHKNDIINDTLDIAKELDMSHVELDKVLKSLLVDDYVVLEVLEKKYIELTKEGEGYVEKGTPEYQYASALELNVPTLKKDVSLTNYNNIYCIG